MAQVSDKTLAWLWSVLQHGYTDPEYTYSAAARALAAYPSLSPRTEVYTHENGSSALLLTLAGTLPVAFRGTTYRFPLKLWIPQSYPREAPMVYVTPGPDMAIRPGQHVGVDGRVYHPYLADWARMWDRASVEQLLGFLAQVFEREPPVISRAQQAQYQRPIGQQGQQHGGAPQPPPKQRVGSPSAAGEGDVPPPRPPKPGEEGGMHQRAPSRDVGRDGPPLPPLPHERPASGQYGSPRPQQNGYAGPSRPPSQAVPPRGYQNGTPPGPPLPPVPGQQQQQYPPRQGRYEQSPVSPVSPVAGYSELPERKYARPAPLPPQMQPPPANQYHQQFPQPPDQRYAQPPPQQYQQYRHPSQQNPQQPLPPQMGYPQHQQPPNPATQQPPKPQPPPDLLTDPFDIALPTPNTNQPAAPAPPIPPNPEKEHLLSALSATLTSQATHKIEQNTSFLPPLRAQHAALTAATQTLQSELAHLRHLDAAIASNTSILHASLARCDAVAADARATSAPSVDEMLVVPSVVGTQLWGAVADAEACAAAMGVLQRGVDRGRVGGAEFVRGMRALGRERFLRLSLARKCGRGLGIEVGGMGR